MLGLKVNHVIKRVQGKCTMFTHYNDVTMSAMASQMTSLTIVHSTVYSRRRSKKTSKLRVTGLCKGISPVTGEFPAQRASNAENVSIWWRHQELVTQLGTPIKVPYVEGSWVWAVKQIWFLFQLHLVTRPRKQTRKMHFTKETCNTYWHLMTRNVKVLRYI